MQNQGRGPRKSVGDIVPLQANRHIDLHIHSTASDGSLSPEQIVKQAAHLKLAAISITDHDTVAGVIPAKIAAAGYSIQFISGVEISAVPPREFQISGSIHILGFGFDPAHKPLNQMLDQLKQARRNRAVQILSQLKKAGVVFSTKAAAPKDPNTPMSRPHIAKALVSAGVVATVDAAFDQYLGFGKIGYVDKTRVPYQEALDQVRAAGGVSILAHPGLIRLPEPNPMDHLIRKLVTAGLGGLEALYPLHTDQQTETFSAQAKKLNLLVTGGTDFHGAVTPNIRMGEGRGDFHVPWQIYSQLLKALPQSTQNSSTTEK